MGPSQFVSPCVSFELGAIRLATNDEPRIVSTESGTGFGFSQRGSLRSAVAGAVVIKSKRSRLDEPSYIFGDGRSVLQYSTFGTEAWEWLLSGLEALRRGKE
jgi:hypothetical protein